MEKITLNDVVVVIVLLLFGFAMGLLVTGIITKHRQPQEVIRIIKAPVIIRYDTINDVIVTVYHPTIKECGNNRNITSTGEIGRNGTVAVSQKLLNYYCNFGDSIKILSGILSGTYLVNDRAGAKGLLIDVWRNVGDNTKMCYKSKVIILKK